ncbi:WD repeat-containing protein 97 [Dermochelys coriacea]|uniref:WD repeat-containing protein 97 n=1 Tax=Dermochelys coriacea TaxID=27794 RepID=UPI001CA85E0B|nr:WD repeat-containing protein 97 [Dermochelys coriacea]
MAVAACRYWGLGSVLPAPTPQDSLRLQGLHGHQVGVNQWGGGFPVSLSTAAASTEAAATPSAMRHPSPLPEVREEETQLTSARRLWALLRAGIQATTEKMKKEELKAAQLIHGLQHLRHLSFPQPVRHVAYNSSASLLVVLDAESQLHLHKEDGWFSHSSQAPGPIAGLLYATQVNKYVAWDQGSLQVLGPDFKVLSKVLAPHGIRCCHYSPELNQVVTAGAGSLSTWAFRYGFRQLQCQTTVQRGLSPRDTFSRLALDTGIPQTCFAACGTGVAVFNISQGELLTFQRDLHNRAITDITYCEAGGCVVTASRDTTIKVWDKKWLIQTIFVGHTGPVTAVTIYPQGPFILSASQDGTIRTWNLQTIDQVDEVHVTEVVEQLQTHPEGGYVTSLSGSTMDLWKVNQLYSLHTRLGATVTRLCTVDLSAVGSFPVRVVCACQDSTVRLVAAHTGHILSTLLLDRPCQAVEVAYCLPKETLFVLLELGQLLRVNTAVNPMSVKKIVVPWSESVWPRCLLLYSHLVDPEKAYAQWREIVEQKGDKKSWTHLPLKLQDKNRYLPVLGQEDGSLCVLQWFTGRVQYQVKAHGSERVTALAAYPHDSWIISAGGDRTVKVWRIFPYIDECLTLLLSFSCQHPVLHMCPLGSTLGTAIQDPESTTYSIVQYDLLALSCQEHGPEDDPLDEITGLCCCPTLKLFASASRDGSVKVWNAQNQLLRHLKLNTIPESLAFGNECGDLLLGVEQHLHRIHHSKYLPRLFLTKLLCMSLLDPVQDAPFPISEGSLQPLNKDARQRLLLDPRSLSVKLCMPLLPWKLKKDKDCSWLRQEKDEACAQLAARDQDLLLIQQGKLSAAKKPRLNKKLQDEAFERYMHLVYRQLPRIQLLHWCLAVVHQAAMQMSAWDPVTCTVTPSSFVPQAPVADGVCREDALEPRAGRGSRLALPTPSASRGLEDSLRRTSLARIRSQISQARQEAAAASESQHTSSHSRSPSQQITKVNGLGPSASQVSSQTSKELPHLQVRRLSSGFLPNSVVVQQFWSQDDIESSRESLQATWLEVQQGQVERAGPERGKELQGAEEEEDEMARTTAILEKISVSLPVPKWKEESLASRRESTGASRPQVTSATCAPVTEPASPEPAWTSSVTSVFLTQLDEFEQPQAFPSRGEIPSFVLQFEDTEWFRQIYPVLSSMDSLQGLSMSGFVHQLLEALLTVDYSAKTDIVQAILTLHEQVGVENGREVCKALLLILNKSDPPKLKEKTQKKFVLTSLNALMVFCRDSKELLLELMAYFLHSPISSRQSIKALFIELGLEDPHDYFYQEMDSWDLSREKPVTKAALRRICAQWLEGVMQDFQDHRSSTLEPFQAWVGKRHFPGSSPKAKKAAGRSKVFPSAGSSELSLGPIDAINHFCKVQMKRDLEDLKQPKSAGAQETKNTVMALPFIGRSQAILRLGETNTMARRRLSQRFYLPRIFPLPLLKGFVHAIKLPVPRINVNPFPPDSDMPASQNTFISMHQKVQKYFIPKFSLGDSYP